MKSTAIWKSTTVVLILYCAGCASNTQAGSHGNVYQNRLIGIWVPVTGATSEDYAQYRAAVDKSPDVRGLRPPPQGIVLKEGGTGYLFEYIQEKYTAPRSGIPIKWHVEDKNSLSVSMVDEEGGIGDSVIIHFTLEGDYLRLSDDRYALMSDRYIKK